MFEMMELFGKSYTDTLIGSKMLVLVKIKKLIIIMQNNFFPISY